MNAQPAPRIAVTALGHPDRGDDAAGLLVADVLETALPEDVPVLVHRGDALSLLDRWSEHDAVVCIDAAEALGEPGRIHRFDLSVDTLSPESGTSSHALGLAETIALGRELGLTPKSVIVYAIEGRCFDAGAEPTPEVAAAVAPAAEEIAREVERLRLSQNSATDRTCLSARRASASSPKEPPAGKSG